MILGADIGNSTTCSSENIIFDSKVAKISKELSNKGKLNFQGKRFFIGQGNYDTEYRKIAKDIYLPLLFTLLSKSTNCKQVELCLGLPLSQYQSDKEKLIELIKENYHLEGILDGIEHDFYITDVMVFPEGVSAIDKNYEGIVVDIGGRTTDVCFVENINGMKKVIKPQSIPSGTINLQLEFINAINSRYGLDLKLNDFNRILRCGLSIYGEKQDITFAVDIFKDYLEDLIKNINTEYNLKINNVCFMGGGSIMLHKPILNRLPHANLINDIFCNAIAYKKLGEELYR